MRSIVCYLMGGLMVVACGGDPSNANQQARSSAGSVAEAAEKTEIANPPNPCSMLTAGAARTELGVRSVTAAPENSQAGQGAAPWRCAFQSGDAAISLVAKRSSIGSERGAEAVAAAYGADAGSNYAVAPFIGAGVVNLVRQEGAASSVVAWTGLVWAGDGNGELIVEAEVATDAKSPEERQEIANALAEIYVGTARQVAAMGG